MVAPLAEASSMKFDAPRTLFRSSVAVRCNISQFAVGGNGRKFLMIEPAYGKELADAREPLHVMINWAPGLPH